MNIPTHRKIRSKQFCQVIDNSEMVESESNPSWSGFGSLCFKLTSTCVCQEHCINRLASVQRNDVQPILAVFRNSAQRAEGEWGWLWMKSGIDQEENMFCHDLIVWLQEYSLSSLSLSFAERLKRGGKQNEPVLFEGFGRWDTDMMLILPHHAEESTTGVAGLTSQWTHNLF